MPEVVDPTVVLIVCLTLGNFIVVVRELEVNATSMDINGWVWKNGASHGRALDMPAWAALTPRRVPLGLAWLRLLPKCEIFGSSLITYGILGGEDTLTFFHSLCIIGRSRLQLIVPVIRASIESLHIEVN